VGIALRKRLKRAVKYLKKNGFWFVAMAVLVALLTILVVAIASHKSLSEATEKPTESTGVVGLETAGSIDKLHVDELLALTNKERQAASLSPLTLNDKLNASANAKCSDMVAKNYWAHNDPTGQTPWHFMTDASYDYNLAGENLAYGYGTSSSVVNGWMNSPGHKANILNAGYTELGFGICRSDNYNSSGPEAIVVQHFASPRASSQSTQAVPQYKPYVAPVCTKIPIPYSTTYVDASYMDVGQTSSSGGIDGYTNTCTADSTGYQPPDYTISPINKTVYTGTRTAP
jgi:uncharacterized protein YkwD